MQHIAAHLKRTLDDKRKTERGDLMLYFCGKLNGSRMRDNLPPITMPRMGKLLEKIPTKDLYYLKRVCDDAEHFSKKFWWEIDPKKHREENTNAAYKKRARN